MKAYQYVPFLFFFIFGVVAFSLPIFFLTDLLYDDAYIHARIARNWIEFGFPNFNIGQVFKASSSTGYIIFLATIGRFVDIFIAIKIYQILAICLFTFSSIKIFSTFDKSNCFVNLVLILSITPVFLYTVYGGMETSMIIPLLMLFFIYYHENKTNIALLLITLLVILRIEMLTIFLLMIILYLIKKKYKDIFISSVFLSIFFIYELYLFGTIIPHAAGVKSIAYDIPLIESFLKTISLNANLYGPHIGLLLIFIFLYQFFLFFDEIIKKKIINEQKLFSLFFLGSAIAIISSWFIGGTIIFPWYIAPVCGLLLIYALKQINFSLAEDKTNKILSIVLILSLGNIGSMDFIKNVFMDSTNQRTYEYSKIGEFLYSQCPSCSLVTSEVGALGWAFQGKVLDGFGLGDPEALSYHPLKVPEERSGHAIGAIPPGYIEYRNPDFIVSLPIFIEKFLQNDNNLYYKYQCETSNTYFGSNFIFIFSKDDIENLNELDLNCSSYN